MNITTATRLAIAVIGFLVGALGAAFVHRVVVRWWKNPLADWTHMTPTLSRHWVGYTIAGGSWTTWRPTSTWAINHWRHTT